VREGRPHEVKERVATALFDAAKTHLADVIGTLPVMVSLEVREIDARLAPKINTVRDRIEGKSGDG